LQNVNIKIAKPHIILRRNK